jgi:hypothetical protein
MGRACSTNGEKRNANRMLVGKPEGKRPVGRPRQRWVENIKMDLREDGAVWTGLILLRIGTSEYASKPLGSIKCWEILE